MSGPWEATSAETDKVIAAFTEALGQLDDITKDREADAGTYKYSYADLAAATSSSRPVLAQHGLAVTQGLTVEGNDVMVRTTVMHTSGQWLCYHPLAMPAGKTAQSAGSGSTYGRRYSLMGALGLATEDDDGAGAGTRQDTPQRAPEPTYSAAAHALLAELKGLRGTVLADAIKAHAAAEGKGLSLADLDDAAWRDHLTNWIDEIKHTLAEADHAAAAGSVGEAENGVTDA